MIERLRRIAELASDYRRGLNAVGSGVFVGFLLGVGRTEMALAVLGLYAGSKARGIQEGAETAPRRDALGVALGFVPGLALGVATRPHIPELAP